MMQEEEGVVRELVIVVTVAEEGVAMAVVKTKVDRRVEVPPGIETTSQCPKPLRNIK